MHSWQGFELSAPQCLISYRLPGAGPWGSSAVGDGVSRVPLTLSARRMTVDMSQLTRQLTQIRNRNSSNSSYSASRPVPSPWTSFSHTFRRRYQTYHTREGSPRWYAGLMRHGLSERDGWVHVALGYPSGRLIATLRSFPVSPVPLWALQPRSLAVRRTGPGFLEPGLHLPIGDFQCDSARGRVPANPMIMRSSTRRDYPLHGGRRLCEGTAPARVPVTYLTPSSVLLSMLPS
ncbi:hypothetical protein B0T24DRAFT_391958 [Lasiosphaeria ovina]|uniref:Uncharacterized protein n=1 Tax=Lasiosphaeria ovina TaxID=92902 RepID=A0AAE0JXG9_9PEZI|nr:hypothetical protein B0T24DRAFT_391958 [Lasiosphaeria ovina]